MYEYKALITKVVDGDTVDAIVELGFYLSAKLRLRLDKIDAPEMRGIESELGKISKQYLIDRILNKEVIIQTQKSDVFGRWLATIFLEGEDINDTMLKTGYAKEYK